MKFYSILFSFILISVPLSSQTKKLHVYVAGKQEGSTLSKMDATIAGGVIVKDESDASYPVKKFTLYVKVGEKISETKSTSYAFTSEQKAELGKVLEGSKIIIDEITVVDDKGKTLKAPKASYTVR